MMNMRTMMKVNQLQNKIHEWLYNANDAQTICDDICEIFGWDKLDQDEVMQGL